MTMQPKAVFLINLLQDVNILRPLVIMASRDFGFEPLLLISPKFAGRDLFGIWQTEIDQLCEHAGATAIFYTDDLEASRYLSGTGVIFAGSESNLPAHGTTHNVFGYAPPGFLKVTLQHGFECIGFRHSADHVLAHGATASFGADIVCAWYGEPGLASLAPSQRGKLLVTGPTAVLQQPAGDFTRAADAPGLVCENLHSVRLNIAGDFRSQFVNAFGEFCDLLKQAQRKIVLRPHPGGQYVLKNTVPLPANAQINNAPMYKLDLRKFSYGISAPSSVLVDMMLADIPTAVWRDRDGAMDADGYAGLTTVSSPAEWFEFGREANANPEPFRQLQRRFLDAQAMPLDPREVLDRFARIFRAAARIAPRPGLAAAERDRILFVANANVPTLQLSFEKPLAPLVQRGELVTELLTEQDLREAQGGLSAPDEIGGWIDRKLDGFAPRMIVFCRYSGPHYNRIIDWARREQVPVLYHIDDDLLAIPEDIGLRKHALHNSPERLGAVRFLLEQVDLVYASTAKLKARLREYYPQLEVTDGKIYCSSSVMRTPPQRPARKVGYMASADHAHNLAMILPAIIQLLDRNPHVGFGLFGSISIPAELERFGNRITAAPPIANYGAFLQEFAKYEWDVGICPLAPIDFNLMKANTKWVEYTTVGAAVVASRGTVYDDCCADGCGMLADSPQEWLEALELLINDDSARIDLIRRAQQKLETKFGLAQLREQVLEMFAQCRVNASNRPALTENLEDPHIAE